MIKPSQVSAVFVTKRVTQDLARIIANLPAFASFVIYDHSSIGGEDPRIYGRYIAAGWAPTDYIYTQDDDCLVPAAQLLERYSPGQGILCNMSEDHRVFYADSTVRLVGWGAVFERHLIAPAFARYDARFPRDPLFFREADRIFTGLTPSTIVNLGKINLESASSATRMCAQSDHVASLREAQHRVTVVLEARNIDWIWDPEAGDPPENPKL